MLSVRLLFVAAFFYLPVSVFANPLGLKIVSSDIIKIDEGVWNNLVSVAPVSDNYYVLSNYNDLFVLDRKKGSVCRVRAYDSNNKIMLAEHAQNGFPYVSGARFNPTGVFVGANAKLFVANYKGNNIISGGLDLENCLFRLEKEISSPDTLGPENVFYSEGVVYSANYDAGTVTAHEYSSGKQLWSANVPQAHGVTVWHGFVYATGLTERKVYEISAKNGSILRTSGQLGWNPMANEFIWPTSIQSLSDSQLIVADAQSGYISLIDRSTLDVVRYFGGNGAASNLFNYPYAAFPYKDEIIVLSSMRGEIFFIDRKGMNKAIKLSTNIEPWPLSQSIPFGIGWDKYVDKYSTKLKISGRDYYLGFGSLNPDSVGSIIKVPDYGTFFNPGSYLYFLQGFQVDDVAVFFSSSSPWAFGIVEKENYPPLLLPIEIALDSWLVGKVVISRSLGVQSLDKFSEDLKKRASSYYEYIDKKGWLEKVNVYDIFGKPNKIEYDRLMARLDIAFSSAAGRRFKLAYDRCDNVCDIQGLKRAALNYFFDIKGSSYISMDEYFLVGMLSGVGEKYINKIGYSYSDCGVGKYYKDYGLEALSSRTLDDYLSALNYEGSSVCLTMGSRNIIKGISVVWNDIATAAQSVEVYARDNLQSEWAKIGDFSEFSIDDSDGYARTNLLFDKEYTLEQYRLVITNGGVQNRLIVREIKPIISSHKDEDLSRSTKSILNCADSDFYFGYGVESLISPLLDDYLSALSLDTSSICFSSSGKKAKGIRLGWYSEQEVGKSVDVYGFSDFGSSVLNYIGSFSISNTYNVSGLSFSDLKFNKELNYPYYKVKLRIGGGRIDLFCVMPLCCMN